MQQHPKETSVSDPNPLAREAHLDQLEDLHQRIETLERLDESEFGEFTRTDWVICTVGALIIPSLVLLWFGR